LELKDILNYIITGYAALVSTYLGYLKLKEGRRQVKVDLDIIEPQDTISDVTYFNVRVVNTGFRTVKITEGEIKRCKFRWGPMESDRKREFRVKLQDTLEELPVTLNTDHDSRILFYGTNTDWSNGYYVQVYIYDIEGNVYKSRKTRHKIQKPKASDNLK